MTAVTTGATIDRTAVISVELLMTPVLMLALWKLLKVFRGLERDTPTMLPATGGDAATDRGTASYSDLGLRRSSQWTSALVTTFSARYRGEGDRFPLFSLTQGTTRHEYHTR